MPDDALPPPASGPSAGTPVAPPFFDAVAPPSAAPGLVEAAGTVIAGRYELARRIGEGGMGSVWLAEQREPVRRQVAVKLVKSDLSGERVLARFAAERQAIALMAHPNIAKLLDAGAEAGQPFFVMELVAGVPLTRFADENGLTVPDRLRLFQAVCGAVQHAHQKGVIHRDLKPSNVLVESHDGAAVPKVIDFGLAKATTGGPLTDRTLDTGFGTVLGTPLYMAPEQAAFDAVDVDTRADVYALGVILYELLTGTTPITRDTGRNTPLDEMLRLIREQDAPTPSSRLAALRRADAGPSPPRPAARARNLHELDWIVMKALAKERERRYESAAALAADVGRYLADEPVLAGPPSARYRLRKFVARHRGQVLAATAILLALVAGVIGTSIGLIRADALRRTAEDERAKAERAEDETLAAYRASTDDVLKQLIGSRPTLGVPERAYLQKTLTRWQAFAARIGDDKRSRAIRAEGLFRVAKLRAYLGDWAAAERDYRDAVALHETLAETPEHRERRAEVHENLGLLLVEFARAADAENHLKRGLELRQALAAEFGEQMEYHRLVSLSHNNLGTLYMSQANPAAAVEQFRAAVDLATRHAGPHPHLAEHGETVARYRSNLGGALVDTGQSAEAEREYREAVAIGRTLYGQFSTVATVRQTLVASLHNLGQLSAARRQFAAAEEFDREAVALGEKLVTDFPAVPGYKQSLAKSHSNLGVVLLNRQKMADAQTHLDRAVALLNSITTGPDDPPGYRRETAQYRFNLGVLFEALRQYPTAEDQYRRALALQSKLVEQFPLADVYRLERVGSLLNLGSLAFSANKPAEGLDWTDQAIAALDPAKAGHRSTLANAHRNRANVLHKMDRFADAVAAWDRVVELSPASEVPKRRAMRAQSLVRAGREAEAIREVEDLTKSDGWGADNWYLFARVYGLAADRVPAERAAYSARAMGLLTRAVQAGFRDGNRVASDAALAHLRNRDDFQKLLASLEAPPPPMPKTLPEPKPSK